MDKLPDMDWQKYISISRAKYNDLVEDYFLRIAPEPKQPIHRAVTVDKIVPLTFYCT